MDSLTSVGEVPLQELKQEYLKMLTPESQELIDFLRPYYTSLDIHQHPVPTLLINWFKDIALNYQNIMHQMKIQKYTVSKVSENTIKQGNTNKAYQEQFTEEFENNSKKVKVIGFTNYEQFVGSHAKKNPQFQIPPEFQKYLQLAKQKGGKQKQTKKRIKTQTKKQTKKQKGGVHTRRGSRVRSMFRDYGNMNKIKEKYENKIKFLNDKTPYLIKAFIVLYQQYKENPYNSPLKNILDEYYPLEKEKEEIFKFLREVSEKKQDLKSMAFWLNENGKLLIRGFSQMFSSNKIELPYELNKRMKYNAHMYNEFFPLIIQDYVEKRLNKRYEFSVELPVGNSESLKLDLEVLSKSYFEPIEFPVYFNIKPTINDNEYTIFLKEKSEQSGGGEQVRRKKNISFMLARFLLVQNLHMPWIKMRNINAKIMMTPFTKQLPYNPKKIILGANEINSGSRYNNNINIWRREELNKLIIHETIHQAEVDFSSDLGLDNFIRNNMAIDPNSEIRLYESYTEICAFIINLMVTIYEIFLVNHKWDKYANQLQSHYQPSKSSPYKKKSHPQSEQISYKIRRTNKYDNKSNKKINSQKILKTRLGNIQSGGLLEGYSLDIKMVIKEVKKVIMIFIKLEQLFAGFQVAKILHFYGFQNMQEFLTSKSKTIKQETSVLSYFIIKGGLLNSITKFVSFIMDMNPNQNFTMNLKFDISKSEKFKDLINDCIINNIGYHKTIDQFMMDIRNNKMFPLGPLSVKGFSKEKTLRMTLIEISDEIYPN